LLSRVDGWLRLVIAAGLRLEEDRFHFRHALSAVGESLARVVFGGKTPTFYWHNAFFWLKMALFGLVFTLEVTPMATFMRVRSARRRNLALPRFPVDAYRRINTAETVLVVAIVFVAAFMARGVWLF